MVIYLWSCIDVLKLDSHCGENFQRQNHIPVPKQRQHLVTDAAPFSWIKGALLGKSPAPLDLLTQTLPALDQAFIWLCIHRCCGEDETLLLFL